MGSVVTVRRNKAVALTVMAASAIAAAFHLYAAGYAPFTALIQRPVHLALMGTLGFLGVGVVVRRSKTGQSGQEDGEDPEHHEDAPA